MMLEETEVAPLSANELAVGVNNFDTQSVSTVKASEVHSDQRMPTQFEVSGETVSSSWQIFNVRSDRQLQTHRRHWTSCLSPKASR